MALFWVNLTFCVLNVVGQCTPNTIASLEQTALIYQPGRIPRNTPTRSPEILHVVFVEFKGRRQFYVNFQRVFFGTHLLGNKIDMSNHQ